MVDLTNISPAASNAWEQLIQSWGAPLSINSAYRSPAYNAQVGGAPKSQHTHGNAYDVDVSGLSQDQRGALIRAAQQAGFTGIGVYDNSLHFDVGPKRAWGPSFRGDSLPEWAAPYIGTSPRMSTSNSPQSIAADTMAALGMRGREMPQQQPMGLLEQLGIQKMGSGGPQGDVPFYQRDRFKDTAGALALALNDMQLRPGQGLSQNVAMGRQRRDANKTAAWLSEQPGGAEFAQMIEAGADPAQVLMAYRQATAPVAPEKTAAQKNYEFLVSQGVDPQAAMARAFQGGVNVNLGDQGPQVGTIPQGYQMVQDPQTGAYRMEPIPGGPEDTSKFEQAGAENQAAGAVNVLEVLEDLASDVSSDPLLTGILGAMASSVPGTGAYDAARTADTIRANLAFDALTAMRKESPTGGALGAVSERELQLLESQISSLDLRQSKAKVLESVNRIRNEYVRILRKAYETGDPARLDAMFGGRPSFLGERPEDKVLTYDPATGEFK